MADVWEITIKNNRTGKQSVCSKEEWDVLRKHPTLKGTCGLVSKRHIVEPKAAIEANEAKKAASKTIKKTKKLGAGRAPKTTAQSAGEIKTQE